MAKVIISLDTETLACGIALDGVPIDTEGFNVGKYKCIDGTEQVSFSCYYTQKGGNGLVEERRMRLPYPEEMNPGGSMAGMNAAGLIDTPATAQERSRFHAAAERAAQQRPADSLAKARQDVASFFGRPASAVPAEE